MEEKLKCSVPWCNAPSHSLGFCKSHYRRNRRKGNPVDQTSMDLKGFLNLYRAVLSAYEGVARSAHSKNSHKASFEACPSGFCPAVQQFTKILSDITILMEIKDDTTQTPDQESHAP